MVDEAHGVDVHALHASDFILGQHSKPKRSRRPRLDRVIAQAERAGKTVTGITTPEGVTLTFGQATDTDRELAEFEARHGKA